MQIYRDAARQRSGARFGAGDLGGDAGDRAAGARRTAAGGRCSLANATEQDFNEKLHSDPTITFRERFPNLRLHRVGQPAAVPAAEFDRAGPGQAAGRTERLRARVAQQDLIVRVIAGVPRCAAGAVQHRADRKPEGSGQRESGAGEAQLRSRHRDDHRHQRCAGQVRPDRRPGNLGPKRSGQQARGAARDHRPHAQGAEAIRPGSFSLSCRSPNTLEPWVDKAIQRESPGAHRAGQLRHRDARGRPAAGAGHYPTLDLVASFNQGYAGGAAVDLGRPPISPAIRAWG